MSKSVRQPVATAAHEQSFSHSVISPPRPIAMATRSTGCTRLRAIWETEKDMNVWSDWLSSFLFCFFLLARHTGRSTGRDLLWSSGREQLIAGGRKMQRKWRKRGSSQDAEMKHRLEVKGTVRGCWRQGDDACCNPLQQVNVIFLDISVTGWWWWWCW